MSDNYTVHFYSTETDDAGRAKQTAISLQSDDVASAVSIALARAEAEFGPVSGLRNICVQDPGGGTMVKMDGIYLPAIYAKARKALVV